MVEIKIVPQSSRFSFSGWSLFRWLLKRKKTAITLLGVLIGMEISDKDVAIVASGFFIEGIWAILEYYVKKKESIT